MLSMYFSDCNDNLLKPEHKLMKTCSSLLQNVAGASGMLIDDGRQSVKFCTYIANA